MKAFFRIVVVTMGLQLLSVVCNAQVCETGKPEPVKNVSIASRAGTATLVGFAEFTATSTPPKLYRKQVTSGTMYLGQWSVAGCPGANGPVSYQASFPPTENWWANSTGSAALEPIAVDAANNRVKYRLTGMTFTNHTQSSPWGDLWALRVAARPADGSPTVNWISVGQEIWLSRAAAQNPYSMFIQGYWALAGWVGHGQTQKFVNVRGAVDRSIRDEWSETVEYPRLGGNPVTTGGNVRRVGVGTFPLVSGGTPEAWPGFASAAAAYGGLARVDAQNATDRRITGKAECMGAAPLFQRAEGTVTQSLSEEDTEEDAMARALITAGSSNVAYRDRRTTGFSFAFSEFTFDVPLQIECEGTYLVHFHFQRRARNLSAEPVKFTRTLEKKFSSGAQQLSPGRFDITTMQLTLPEGEMVPLEYDTEYALMGVELERSCPESEPGKDHIWRDSVHVHLSLGLGEAGRSAGKLMLDAAAITPALFSPAALNVATPYGSGTAVLRDANGVLRQVKAPAALADVAPLDASAFEVRFYAVDAIGIIDPETGFYVLTGSPYVIYKFENPDPATSTRLRVSRIRGSQVRVSEFGRDSDSGSWTFSTGNGLKQERIEVEDLGDSRLETTTVTGLDEEPVAKIWREIRVFPWGEETVLEINDPDGAALTTTSEFYATEGEPGYGLLKRRVFPDGSFAEYTYDAQGRPLESVRPFSGHANGDPLRRTMHAYATLADADGDTITEDLTATVEYIGDDEVSRNYVIQWSRPVQLGSEEFRHRSDVRVATAGAAWDATGNLVTELLTYGPGRYNGQSRRQLNPDGTVKLTHYTVDASGLQSAVSLAGAPNATLDDVIAGTHTETVTNPLGRTLSEAISDVASGRVLSAWQAVEFDLLGRPTRIDYDDGTQLTREFACCGVATESDRSGSVTSYNYDDLGRQYEVARDGIKMRTAFDAEGRVLSTTRIGSDGSEMRLAANLYDLAGRLIEERDAMDRPTTHGEEVQPLPGVAQVRTTTAPDGGTRIETFNQDGSMASVTGTAVAPRSYQYGVDADGIYTHEIKGEPASEPGPMPGSGAPPPAAEWTKTSTDFLGRAWKTAFADGACAFSHFNAFGQLVRTVDPDSFATLYAYNDRGEQDVVALDLNADGLINYDGTDRITRTVTEVGEREGMVVQRVVTQFWESDGVDAPTTTAVSEQTPNGRHAWQTIRGLTTSNVTSYDGAGGRTVTTTAPDQVQTVQVFASDRLMSTTVQAPSLGVISSAAFSYDTHGRLETATDARNGTTAYTYFADDQICTITTPDPDPTRAGVGYDPQLTTYAYDECGRVATVTQPDGGEVHTTYWPTGQIMRTWGARTYPVEYTYDPQGRLQTLITWQDFAGDTGRAVTTWNYHPLRGWLSGKRYNDGTGPDYTYYPSGRLHTRTGARTPSVTTTFHYSTAGDLMGIDYSDATPDVATTYDRVGRPVAVTDGGGQRNLAYHASGRIQNENYITGLLASTGVHRTHDAFNRLESISILAGPVVLQQAGYAYDSASRLDSVTAGANTATYGYVPDAPLVETVTFWQAGTTRLTTTRAYDKLNRVSFITNTPGSTLPTPSFGYVYNTANQRIRTVRETGAWWSYGYDALGQVNAAEMKLLNDEVMPGHAFSYTFDDIGNRRSASRNAPSAAAVAKEDYTANLLNQYSERTFPGSIEVLGAAQPGATVTVMSPAVGGSIHPVLRQGELYHLRLPVDNSGSARFDTVKVTGVMNLVGPNGEDAVTEETRGVFVPATPEVFSHDTDGNFSADARWTYAWDAENRLVTMETSFGALAAGAPGLRLEFGYDGQSRRISKKVNNWTGAAWVLASHTLFLYDGWHMIAELDALNGNTPIRTYVWGLDLSVSMQGAGGVGGLLFANASLSAANSHALAYDANGNVTGLADMATGTMTATYEYSPFGETITADGPAATANPIRFSTKYTDPETNLLYYGYRYYSPTTGRWLSRDPAEEAEGGPNLYALNANDSVNKIDPLGLWSVDEHYDIITKWLGARGKLPPGSTYTQYRWHCYTINVEQALKNGNDDVDGTGNYTGNFFAAQSTQNSYQHAMRAPGQTVASAREQMVNFINSNKHIARQSAESARSLLANGNPSAAGGESYIVEALAKAIHYLGRAQHPVADMTSPLHAGFQKWDGLDTAGALAKGYNHHRKETLGLYAQQGGYPATFVKNVMDGVLDEILKP